VSGRYLSSRAAELFLSLGAQEIPLRTFIMDQTKEHSTMSQESTSTGSAKPATTDGTNSTTSSTENDQNQTSTTFLKEMDAKLTTDSQEPSQLPSLPPTDGGEPSQPIDLPTEPGEPEPPVLSDDQKKKIKREKDYKEHKKHSADVPDGLMIQQLQQYDSPTST